jgi:hypothetical protein
LLLFVVVCCLLLFLLLFEKNNSSTMRKSESMDSACKLESSAKKARLSLPREGRKTGIKYLSRCFGIFNIHSACV